MAQATLVGNGINFSPYVAFDGVKQGYTERLSRSVVTLDGTKIKAAKKKRTISVELHDMYHEDLVALFGNFPELALWSYLDADKGSRTAYFYLTGPNVSQKKARDGKTLCSGISFTLEEK